MFITLKEAEKILELPENYTEQHVKEKHKTLMRRYHLDMKNEISLEEKTFTSYYKRYLSKIFSIINSSTIEIF